MTIRPLVLLLVCIGFGMPACAQTIPKIRSDLLSACAEENLLCRHLRTVFKSPLSSKNADGIPIWRRQIRYITAGMTQDGDSLFDELIESFGIRAGVKVERVPLERAREANLTFLVTPNVAEAFQGKRSSSLLGNALSDDERAQMATDWKSGFSIIRMEHDPISDRYEVAHCYAGIHPDSLKKQVGLRFATAIYRCLTGASSSDVLRPSLSNATLPIELDAPPYAKMTSLDRALLELMYGPNSPVTSSRSATVVVERIEKRLREQGFGDDGLKH
jgi:hypothetical protein